MFEMTYAIDGLEDLDLADIESDVTKRANMAINKTVDWARREQKKRIMTRFALPGNYLDPSQGRLTSNNSNRRTLSGFVRAVDNPTPLARFARPGRAGSGATIEVVRGEPKLSRRMFFVTFRNGGKGVAIRVPKGQTVEGRRNKNVGLKSLGANVFLLYGPSIDQMFDQALKSAGDSPQTFKDEVADYLENEYLRLVDLDL